jgi:hypothetical protein
LDPEKPSAAWMRQGDVDDGQVEREHELGRRDDGQRQAQPPGRLGRGPGLPGSMRGSRCSSCRDDLLLRYRFSRHGASLPTGRVTGHRIIDAIEVACAALAGAEVTVATNRPDAAKARTRR